jgi:hypothetical protein
MLSRVNSALNEPRPEELPRYLSARTLAALRRRSLPAAVRGNAVDHTGHAQKQLIVFSLS